jgi:hypothetical protein
VQARFSTGAREHTTAHQPQSGFGPDVLAVADFLINTLAPTDYATMMEIGRRWPGLSFRDYVGATVLARAIVMPTEGRA